ncbi:MAG: TIGR04076 family protein [Desulfobacterales bacterium]|jgi:uncharacterized repeat protein (TIGR04076 family)|nr:TIGR04076 family protein [Desulfobacteraceae bacterium]MBT4365122.1 TIGR04076 family protein [Desulfobacteraceae bacterium]MBT7085575.1 TIGR04076 family protein [Desulfobacterales bacterium]MBT7698361.1 TIGR04076 family protein [Desulfobacterales bacterium]
MSNNISKCKITVLKRTINRDLAEEYLKGGGDLCECEVLSDGQEIIVEDPFSMPEGFCSWAWGDIRGDVMSIATGSSLPWMKSKGTMITGCTDYFRPVIFKLERMEE